MSRKRSYCVFAALYFPHLGGLERYTHNLTKRLKERGNQVVIVTSNVYHLKPYEKIEGIHIYRVPCFNILDGRYPVLKLNRQFWKIYRRLRQYQFDMVIVNTRFYFHSLYGMLLARMEKAKCITIDHGTTHLSVHSRFWDTIGEVYEHFLTAIGKQLCKDYYGVSKASCAWLKHFHIKAKGVLYNSIDVDEVEKIRSNTHYSFRTQYHIPTDAVVIAFTGRLLEEKGIINLIHVVERLHKTHKNVYLLIAGDGDLEMEVEAKKSDYIIPLGRIEFEHIVALLAESDIFCLPSFSEGLSTSILEAAACHCYIVTTARGGAKELLVNDKYGSIIPNNKEGILFKELEAVIEDKKRREEGARLTYERVKSYFSWELVADQVEAL